MGRIHTLPEEVSLKIAAGEVIEGPFSVVRELIDNAIDASSHRVAVTINNGGKDLMRVGDDGEGMSQEDALLSIEKHTTSKLLTTDDLGRIATLGFRGEALASICAVSDVTMITREEGSEAGVRIRWRAGRMVSVEPCGANRGTDVTVRDLFTRIPARKKFLRSNRAEAARIKDEVIKKALAFPDLAFAYRSDDRLVLSLSPASERRGRIAQLFGEGMADDLLRVDHGDNGFTIEGYVSTDLHTLPNRNGQYLFLNGRPIGDRSLSYGVNSLYRGFLPAGRYPYVFLFIEMDPFKVDVNVHPAKREVRVASPDSLYGAIREAVRDALRLPPVPDRTGIANGGRAAGLGRGVIEDPEARFPDRVRQGPAVRKEDMGPVRADEAWRNRPVADTGRTGGELAFTPLLRAEMPGGLPRFRGRFFTTYLLFETDRDVILMDQHAAHERVLYESFARRMGDENPLKRLMIPANVTPPRSHYGSIVDGMDQFGKAGVELEPFGEESFNVLTIPAIVPDRREEETLSLFFEEFYRGNLLPDADSLRDGFITLAACRQAVKEGDRLSDREAEELWTALAACRVPTLCPHGRPTLVRVSREHIERVFKRR
jgi:DNA mismatch repair protein MutL